jgi:YD repeat-containing protein
MTGTPAEVTPTPPTAPSPSVLDLMYYYYDPTGNITDIVDGKDATRTAHYAYDDADRLTGATGWWGALGWTYDLTGNRLSETRNTVTSTYSYATDSAGHYIDSRLLQVTSPMRANQPSRGTE